MKKNILYICLFIILISSCSQENNIPKVKSGYIDLGENKLEEIVKLEGEWLFWPNRLLDFTEVIDESNNGYSNFKKYPIVWQKLSPLDPISDIINNGTLALKLDLPINKKLSVRVANGSSALTLFFNKQKILNIGTTSLDINTYIPNNGLKIGDFTVTQKENILIVHITNFSTPYTGTWQAITIGKTEDINRDRFWHIVITCLISGALIFMGIYHFALFALRRDDKTTLIFGLICIFMSTRNLIMGERILIELFPLSWSSWKLAFNIEHLSAHLVLPLFFYFFKKVFPNYVNNVVVKIVAYIGLLWAILQLFTPVMFHQRFLSWYEYFLVISALYLLFQIVRAFKNKEEGAGITLTGILILILTSINDVLLSNGFIQSIYLASIGVFIYTFLQSYSLSKRFSNLFKDVERYTKELKELNSSLERFIPHEILKYLHKDSIVDVKLGDFSEEEMSVFFLDIRDFTSFSETMSPNDNFRFINTFLNRFGPLIRRSGGFVDKYIGDGIMALFPGSPDNALKAALLIRSTLVKFNNERMGYNLVPIRIGIGINTGNLMLGTIGENQRMDSTVISDAVNTASRLESLTKELNVDILVSGNTVSKLLKPEDFRIIHVGTKHLKGKAYNVEIYTIDWA